MMRVQVVRPDDLGVAEEATWDGFQRQSPVMQSPFLSLPFARAVARFRPTARIAVVELDGKIDAFLPFELGTQRIGMPIGYPMNDLQGFVGADPRFDARQVIRMAGLRGWRFTAVPAEQAALMPCHYDGTRVGAFVVDLTGGYEPYRMSLSRSLTAESARKRRALERETGAVSLIWDSCRPEHLRQMVDWKATRYHGTRELFRDTSAMQIIAELSKPGRRAYRGIVSVLQAGERPFAISCNLSGPAGVVGWFTAYDPVLSRFSPGTMLTLALAEEAAARGIARFELGPGQDSYKSRFANQSYPIAGGAVWASRAEAAARILYRRSWTNHSQ
jgi:CelD/BcsL family acetyltransferase involved in cellulose biosynthesis